MSNLEDKHKIVPRTGAAHQHLSSDSTHPDLLYMPLQSSKWPWHYAHPVFWEKDVDQVQSEVFIVLYMH